MDKKEIAIKLSKLNDFAELNINLEQYKTDSEIASELLWVAYQNGDIKGKTIADLGCGNGILGMGALLLDASFVYFLDIDKNALDVCKDNLDSFYKGKNYELILGDVPAFNKKIDTVIMNPPFGVQKRKADKVFLEAAMENSNKTYSIHKIESKKFIQSLCNDHGFSVDNIMERKFILRKTYGFHKKNKYNFDIGIWILNKNF
ncbi:methyltransferase [Candidatus Woesearchaeota archaeon]|nr:methyltransferase [Candidatus Woesearchaeota archaeon]